MSNNLSPVPSAQPSGLVQLSVVVPVYGNEGSLMPLFERLRSIEAKLEAEHATQMQLIFVNDGSPDNAMAVLREIKALRPATTVIRFSRNFGAVHASKYGMRHVQGHCFMVLAADLQDPPELIFDMLERWRAGSKFVTCERTSRDDPALSKFYSALFYKLVRSLVMREYPRQGYDMALMDRCMLEPIINSSKNMFTPLLAYWLGFKPDVIPYERQKRVHGKSGWTFRKKLKAFFDVMLGFSVTPIRLVSAVGAFAAALSFAYGSMVIVNALLGRVPVPGFAALMVTITFLLGLIILMLGIIGEYLWRIFDEVNRRPEVVVEEVL
jgi:polyisoprenyl-phosphate glycosyltransferase